MLTGKVALITGATGGLGPAVARAMLEDGVSVAAVARSAQELAGLQAELQAPDARWLAVAADLGDADSAAGAAKAAVTRFGGLDIVLALAGGWRGGQPVAETDPATLEWLWRVNVATAFNTCHVALPYLTGRGWGRIVTIASRAALAGPARSAAYAATKAAVVALTQSVAAEVKGTGITANAILPATIDTPANRAATPGGDYGKWVTPEQIAAVIRFLCSDEASAINGAAIPVYGSA
jgi:NAD(P)-dependent dehydrogenase (short-subunit alcohol dehydrogenase family)